jgi:aspartate/methionine/tyrosine aminotransferase
MPLQPKRLEGTLTVQEIEAAHLAHHDLGPGYPQIPVEGYVRRLYAADDLSDLSLSFAPLWTSERQSMLDEDLELAVACFLSLRADRYHAMRTTFSGSVALNRALTAVLNESRRAGAQSLDVITTSPSIDIMRLFLAERPDITPCFVESRRRGIMGALDPQALLGRIEMALADRPAARKLVLLTSPENPTGAVWSAGDLAMIAEACRDSDIPLLTDHSFLVAGVQEKEVSRIWDVAPVDGNWLATWDTGKTFGLNEDKLGFVVAGSPEMTRALDESIAVMQFGVARRQKIFFARLLKESEHHNHLVTLRTACKANLRYLRERTQGTAIEVCEAVAGCFALLDCAELDRSDEELRRNLLARGVGVVAGNVFFHGDWKPRHYIRIALAREPCHFAEAVDALIQAL